MIVLFGEAVILLRVFLTLLYTTHATCEERAFETFDIDAERTTSANKSNANSDFSSISASINHGRGGGGLHCPRRCECKNGLEKTLNCTQKYTAAWKPALYVNFTCETAALELPRLFEPHLVESVSFDSCRLVPSEGVWLAALRALGVTHVTRLTLQKAPIHTLTAEALRGLDSLKELSILGNLFWVLPTDLLASTPALQRFTIRGAGILMSFKGLEVVPPSLGTLEIIGGYLQFAGPFRGQHKREQRLITSAFSLKNLTMSRTGLQDLPFGIFSNMSTLERLDLSYNKFDYITPGIFAHLISLKELILDSNKIWAINKDWLTGMSKLRVLSACSCGLKYLSPGALTPTTALTDLLLNNNLLTRMFTKAPEVRDLELDEDTLMREFANWNQVSKLKRLDLAHNHITEINNVDLNFESPNVVVDLRNNRISTVTWGYLPPRRTLAWGGQRGVKNGAVGTSKATILLDDNPFSCDYRLLEFLSLMQKDAQGERGLQARAARCAYPPALTKRALTSIKPDSLANVQPAPPCPTECTCRTRPHAGELNLECLSLPTVFPDPATFQLNSTSLQLLSAPAPGPPRTLPEHVSQVNLSGLGLTDAPALFLSNVGGTLNLSHNALTAVPEALLFYAANVSNFKILLAGNPIRCACNSNTLQLLNDVVIDRDRWQCSGACKRGAAAGGTVLGAGAGGGALCVALAAAAVWWRRWRRRLRRVRANLEQRGLTTEYDDHEAEFDAFVSYAHEDEEWVYDVVRRLEAGGGLRLCLHSRNWLLGEWIPAQITRSVELARRTLLIVSPAWASSPWSQAEWLEAHGRECREGYARVLVVLLCRRPPPGLPTQLRANLAARTYLSHDDPSLIEKLRAALQAPIERVKPVPLALPVPPVPTMPVAAAVVTGEALPIIELEELVLAT